MYDNAHSALISHTKPLYYSHPGGLLFSTFTGLFWVPFCYLMLVKLGERSNRRFAKAKAFADKKMPI
ncbi:MAG: HAE1 family hydrophobic/amphiphilic exporter-1 [Glaciecola sp.]|jgi:HAE1 family hydrophobic/amphiphilic exporter-1